VSGKGIWLLSNTGKILKRAVYIPHKIYCGGPLRKKVHSCDICNNKSPKNEQLSIFICKGKSCFSMSNTGTESAQKARKHPTTISGMSPRYLPSKCNVINSAAAWLSGHTDISSMRHHVLTNMLT